MCPLLRPFLQQITYLMIRTWFKKEMVPGVSRSLPFVITNLPNVVLKPALKRPITYTQLKLQGVIVEMM